MNMQEKRELAARLDGRVVRDIDWAYYRETLDDLANRLWAEVNVSVGGVVCEELGLPEYSENLDIYDHEDIQGVTTAGAWEAVLSKLATVFGDERPLELRRLTDALDATSDEFEFDAEDAA